MRSRVLWPPLPTPRLTVKLSSSYNRQHVSSHFEALLELEWAASGLVSRPLFRLHSTSLPGKCSDVRCRGGYTCICSERSVLVEDATDVTFRVGLSSLKEGHVTQHLTQLTDQMAYIGYELYKEPQMFLADTITNHVVLVTVDGMIPLLRSAEPSLITNGDAILSKNTKLARKSSSKANVRPLPNIPLWTLPFQCPNPAEGSVFSNKDLVSLNSSSVHKEITGSVFRCLNQMIGVKTPSNEKSCFLLAALYDHLTNNKPELIFAMKSGLTAVEVSDTFKKNKSPYELLFISTTALMTSQSNEFKDLNFSKVFKDFAQVMQQYQGVVDLTNL